MLVYVLYEWQGRNIFEDKCVKTGGIIKWPSQELNLSVLLVLNDLLSQHKVNNLHNHIEFSRIWPTIVTLYIVYRWLF